MSILSCPHCYDTKEQAMQAFMPFLHSSLLLNSLGLVSVSPELWYHTVCGASCEWHTRSVRLTESLTAKFFANHLPPIHHNKFFFIPFDGNNDQELSLFLSSAAYLSVSLSVSGLRTVLLFSVNCYASSCVLYSYNRVQS